MSVPGIRLAYFTIYLYYILYHDLSASLTTKIILIGRGLFKTKTARSLILYSNKWEALKHQFSNTQIRGFFFTVAMRGRNIFGWLHSHFRETNDSHFLNLFYTPNLRCSSYFILIATSVSNRHLSTHHCTHIALIFDVASHLWLQLRHISQFWHSSISNKLEFYMKWKQ